VVLTNRPKEHSTMAQQPEKPDQKMLFALSPGSAETDGIETLTLLIPQAAWDYMRNGMCHEFDLTKIGVPLRMVLAGTPTHKTGLELLRMFGITKTKDVSTVDMHLPFGEKPNQ
jgi:hypothetical protein